MRSERAKREDDAVTAERLGYRPGLDGVRGVAVLVVLVGHSIRGFGFYVYAGAGVDVFFVLSGFLITSLLLDEQRQTGTIRLGAFYLRRARRLLPALGVALVLGAYVNFLIGEAVLAPIATVASYTANYVQAAHPDWGGATRHLWSLSIEEHFYLLWPAVVLLVPRRWLKIVCVYAAAVVVLWRIGALIDGRTESAYRDTHLRADGLLIGAGLATIRHRLRSRPWMVPLGFAVLAFAFFKMHPSIWWGSTVAYLGAGLLLVGLLESDSPSRFLIRAGALSYALYLFHPPLHMAVNHFTPSWLAVVIAAPVAWIGAELCGRHIEARFHVTGGSADRAGRVGTRRAQPNSGGLLLRE